MPSQFNHRAGSQHPFAAVVLAGGFSRRFGAPKAMASFCHGRLLDHAATVARQLTPHVWIISSLPFPIRDPQVHRLLDRFPSEGPLAGVLTAFEQIPHAWIAVFPVDMPFLSPAIYRHLWRQRRTAPILCAATSASRYPLVAFWNHSTYPQLKALFQQGIRSVFQALEILPHAFVDCAAFARNTFPSPFFNIHTPEDYQQVQWWCRRMSIWEKSGTQPASS